MTSQEREDQRNRIIIGYYIARRDKDALNILGFVSYAECFRELAAVCDTKPNTLKQVRDEFDPYFSNGRRGWVDRALCESRQSVLDEFKQFTDEQLDRYVRSLIHRIKKSKRDATLLDLQEAITTATNKYKKEYKFKDAELTSEFKRSFKKYLANNNEGTEIEYAEHTSYIKTSQNKIIFVPNQWFVIAAYAVGVYKELQMYKMYYERVVEYLSLDSKAYAPNMRGNNDPIRKKVLSEACVSVLRENFVPENEVHICTKRLLKFVTDYDWWSGHKTIDRNDFYISVVLNMLELVNASQGYVAEIVKAYGNDDVLFKLAQNMDALTTNLVGTTYEPKFVRTSNLAASQKNPETANDSGIVKPDSTKQGTMYIKVTQKSLDRLNKK